MVLLFFFLLGNSVKIIFFLFKINFFKFFCYINIKIIFFYFNIFINKKYFKSYCYHNLKHIIFLNDNHCRITASVLVLN